MNLLNHFHHLILTNDQRNALEKLHTFLLSDEQVFILQGYAGSGKTTLLRGLVEYFQTIDRRYQLMAPTGRAAKVINQKQVFLLQLSTRVYTALRIYRRLIQMRKVKKGPSSINTSCGIIPWFTTQF